MACLTVDESQSLDSSLERVTVPAGKCVSILFKGPYAELEKPYDWLFGQDIAGLITQYGGANSHMAIRAAEIGLPAAIGVGEKLYEEIAKMHQVELDCGNQIIRKIE